MKGRGRYWGKVLGIITQERETMSVVAHFRSGRLQPHLEGVVGVLAGGEGDEGEDGHGRLHHHELQRGLLGQTKQVAVAAHSSQAAQGERVRDLPTTIRGERTTKQGKRTGQVEENGGDA